MEEVEQPKPRGGAREGAGRPKGSLDKGNAQIRELIVTALNNVGGVEYLEKKAETQPQAFLSLIGKVMPTQVTGVDGKDINVSIKWMKS